jgi:hypothetical protein
MVVYLALPLWLVAAAAVLGRRLPAREAQLAGV